MDKQERHERRRSGIEKAKLKGRYKGRRPHLTVSDIKTVQRRVAQGDSKYQIAKDLDISRRTIYNYLPAYAGTPKWKASHKARIAQTKRTGKKAPKRRATRARRTREKDRPFTRERLLAYVEKCIRQGEPLDLEWWSEGKRPDYWTIQQLKKQKAIEDRFEAFYRKEEEARKKAKE